MRSPPAALPLPDFAGPASVSPQLDFGQARAFGMPVADRQAGPFRRASGDVRAE